MARRICTINGCSRPRKGWGFCERHYQRWRKTGDPLGGGTFWHEPETWIENVALEYESDACLIWPFADSGSGYGSLRVNGRPRRAHRVVCEQKHGPQPSPDQEVAHSCGNRRCLNYRHLRWATHVDNMGDAIGHGTSPRGERSGRARLTEQNVQEIRRLSAKMTQRDIAGRFGVHKNTIGSVLNGSSWAWLQSREEAAEYRAAQHAVSTGDRASGGAV